MAVDVAGAAPSSKFGSLTWNCWMIQVLSKPCGLRTPKESRFLRFRLLSFFLQPPKKIGVCLRISICHVHDLVWPEQLNLQPPRSKTWDLVWTFNKILSQSGAAEPRPPSVSKTTRRTPWVAPEDAAGRWVNGTGRRWVLVPRGRTSYRQTFGVSRASSRCHDPITSWHKAFKLVLLDLC